MREFADAARGLPAGAFSFAPAVVIVYWILAECGAVEHDAWESGTGASALGPPGVRLSVAVSVLITAVVLLAVAVLVARAVTRPSARPLRRVFRPGDPPPSRQDFIGLTAVVRTGRVDAVFGQAEVTAADGSTAVVQVRQFGAEPLTYGSTALLYAYDEPGEFFWAAPYDAALDPRTTG
ncbi:hypothetical protein [Streptomyces sp. NPDC097981]|uniref:hypothetical protein n=1 Tax=Streptomyces sp. NPDC097981 TaxID=3155428 RepID=UPI003319A095